MLFLAGSLLLSLSCSKREDLRPDCIINAGPCVKAVEGLTVALDIIPRPVRAMRDLSFDVQLERGGRPAEATGVEVDLTMPGMQMGENRVQLRRLRDGLFRGKGVILRCPSGQALWKASVIVTAGGRVTTADFLLEAP
jgi:hypothetical protein